MVTNDTSPGTPNPLLSERPEPRPVYFTLKSLFQITVIMTTLWAVIAFVFSLMFYPQTDGLGVRSDLDHQIKEVAELKVSDTKLVKAVHRIELRQMEMAPRHVRGNLLPVPDLSVGDD